MADEPPSTPERRSAPAALGGGDAVEVAPQGGSRGDGVEFASPPATPNPRGDYGDGDDVLEPSDGRWGLGRPGRLRRVAGAGESSKDEPLAELHTAETQVTNSSENTAAFARSRVALSDLLTSTASTRSSFEPAHPVQPATIQQVGFDLHATNSALDVEEDGEDGFFSTKGAQWPAFVVPLETFLDLDGLDAHETSVEKGIVREWKGPGQESMLFCSHQWLGFRRPDSRDHTQLRSVQGALRALRRGDIEEVFDTPQDALRTVEAEDRALIEGDLSWTNAAFVDLVRRRLAEKLDNAAVWIDYASISQQNDADLQRGVESLPFYIENSTLFLAVVPPALHEDLRVCCDRRSYEDRGWCRFEMLVAELTGTKCKLLVHSGTSVSVLERGVYFIDEAQCERSVFNGEFSCCRRNCCGKPGVRCDRVRIAGVLEPYFAERVAELHAKGKPHLARLWTCLEARIFAGNPHEGHAGAARLTHRRPRRRVVTVPRYGSDAEPDALGAGPTYYWCAEGRQERVVAGLDAGVDPNFCSAPGITLLLEAALAGDSRMVTLLLSRGADPNAATYKLGITALHRAAQAGHARVLRPLADGGADLDAPRKTDGETPLHRAAAYGRRRAAAELVRLGARIEAEDKRGRTPLDHALAHAHAATVAKLLALGAGPENFRSPPPARIGARDARHAERVAAAVSAEAHLRWFYFAQDRWHASHFRDREERARVLEAFRAFLAVGFECKRRGPRLAPGSGSTSPGTGNERLDAVEFSDEVARAEHCDWTTQLGKIDVDVEPDSDGAYVATARFRMRTEPPPDSPEPPADWALKVRLRVWDAAPFLGAPPKMAAQLLMIRQTRLKTDNGDVSPAAAAARARPVFTTTRTRFRLPWPSFLRKKKVDNRETRFRPAEAEPEPETPKTPFGRLGLRRTRSLRQNSTL